MMVTGRLHRVLHMHMTTSGVTSLNQQIMRGDNGGEERALHDRHRRGQCERPTDRPTDRPHNENEEELLR
ncbi:unnamed protein product [Litomosoides sigmodontis]|uniref:Uncharacterized protein n=1 Tax=Litomosoides sigmodontis TaxID=42156 RepID=A0A3P6UJ33_LITSI|nr:unnamed protein product [Litomosoides sigmodontis]